MKMLITKEKVFCIKIRFAENVLLRYIPGDPPILFNRKTGTLIALSNDLAKFLKYLNQGLTFYEVVKKLEVTEDELDLLIDILNLLVRGKYLYVEKLC